MSVMLWECSWLSKIYSDSKSRVSKVKNSGDIFTLFSPHSKGPCSKTVRESCPQIRVRLKNNLYLAPKSIGFDGKVFYSLWQEMEPPQLVVVYKQAKVFSGPKLFRAKVFPGRSIPGRSISGPKWVSGQSCLWAELGVSQTNKNRHILCTGY